MLPGCVPSSTPDHDSQQVVAPCASQYPHDGQVVCSASRSVLSCAPLADSSRRSHLWPADPDVRWLRRAATSSLSVASTVARRPAVRGAPAASQSASQGFICETINKRADACDPTIEEYSASCGGVGEWQYRSLGGISPARPGCATVTISPDVSPTEGPSGVNMTVSTVRGTIALHWTRLQLRTGSNGADAGTIRCSSSRQPSRSVSQPTSRCRCSARWPPA